MAPLGGFAAATAAGSASDLAASPLASAARWSSAPSSRFAAMPALPAAAAPRSPWAIWPSPGAGAIASWSAVAVRAGAPAAAGSDDTVSSAPMLPWRILMMPAVPTTSTSIAAAAIAG